ncbi:MAG: hypothetical protein GY696_34635 [Gammaproteobacteria bacterium]|nr:hypothetical protein [Gammaproteobacteria bacterium]
MLGPDGITPESGNINPILGAAPPTSVKDVQRFLGAINYFQDFLSDAAAVAEPLKALTHKDSGFQWGAVEDLAFRTLRAMLAQETQLQLFDPHAETSSPQMHRTLVLERC